MLPPPPPPQREAAEQLTEMERRHLQVQLSYEEAIIARESHKRDTRDKAQALREEVRVGEGKKGGGEGDSEREVWERRGVGREGRNVWEKV